MIMFNFDTIVEPRMFGVFHLFWLLIMGIAIILTIKLTKDGRHRKKFLLVVGIYLLISEIYKQFFYYQLHQTYYWNFLPFQLCSIPMYLALISGFCKNLKIVDTCDKFIAYYGLLGGVIVMIYPEVALGNYMVMNIHSMIWHILLVVMGIYLIKVHQFGNNYLKELVPPTLIFGISVIIAEIINISLYDFLKTINQTINLFAISPKLPISASFIEVIFGSSSIYLYICLYLVAILLGVSLIFLINNKILKR